MAGQTPDNFIHRILMDPRTYEQSAVQPPQLPINAAPNTPPATPLRLPPSVYPPQPVKAGSIMRQGSGSLPPLERRAPFVMKRDEYRPSWWERNWKRQRYTEGSPLGKRLGQTALWLAITGGSTIAAAVAEKGLVATTLGVATATIAGNALISLPLEQAGLKSSKAAWIGGLTAGLLGAYIGLKLNGDTVFGNTLNEVTTGWPAAGAVAGAAAYSLFLANTFEARE